MLDHCSTAIKFSADGVLTQEIADFIGAEEVSDRYLWLDIDTPDGPMQAHPGDWIIRDTNGEFHVAKTIA